MGTRLFLLALIVPFSVSLVLSKQGNGSRDRKVHHPEHERPPQKRSSTDGMKTIEPPLDVVYQQEGSPLGKHDDSVPLYLTPNVPPPPSSFPVVAKVVNEEGERTREAMEAVKDVAGALLTMHSYKKGPHSLSHTETGGFGARKNKGVQEQEEEECPYCPSGNCPYCRGKGGNAKNVEEYQQEQCPYCPSGKCPWCHGKGQSPQQNEDEQGEEGGQCPNCPSGKCPWCHGKNQQSTQNNGRCPNCPSGKCPWCHGKNRQTSQQQEEEEYEDEDQSQQQQCPNCPSGKCPWCHGKNNKNNAAATKPAANSFSDYSKVQKGGGGQMTQNEEEGQEQCANCPSGRCPWCGGALTANGKCAGCPDGKCPWCHRNLETGEGPDGSPPPQRCPNCPSGKCPWCHGKNQETAQSTPNSFSAYNNQPANQNNQVEQQEEEEGQQQCADCPSGRCPWCGGALTGNGKCAGCPDGKCPWCQRNLQTGEGPDGSPPPKQNQQCPNCPSGKCPWCHGKNQQQNADVPATQHQGYNNGQSGGCPYCPSGKCPWCHGKGQPPQQQPQTEVEYEYEDEPEETTTPTQKGAQQQNQQQQWKNNQSPPPPQTQNQPAAAHYGPPPGYQPQTPQTYAKVQMPGNKQNQGGYQSAVQTPPTPSTQQQPQEEYEYEEEEPQQQQQSQQQQQQQQQQYGVNYGAIPSTGSVANYQSPGPAPTTPVKFRTGITSAVAPVGSMSASVQQSETPHGVTQSNGAGGCCVISLPPGRYQILPAAKAKSRRKRSTDNFRNRFLLRD